MAKKNYVKTGFYLLDRRMKKLTTKEQKKTFRDSARPAIKPLQQQAKSNAKADKVSGATNKSIKVRSIKRSRSRVGVKVTSESKSFDDDFHAKFHELGWKAGKTKRKLKGNRPIKRAVKAKRRQVIRTYKRNLRNNIKQTARS